MNIIQIMGGLGNQLFQYAFGKAKQHIGLEVMYNVSWYDRHKILQYPRPFRLDKFKTTLPLAQRKLSPIIVDSKDHDCSYFLKENEKTFRGYWQLLEYYIDILPQLKHDFSLKEECYTDEFLRIKELIQTSESTSIHVRRGDYVKPHRTIETNTLPLDYYFQGLLETKGDLFIFSDEIDWCKDRFKQDYFDRKINFIHLEDYLDFELMKLCSHNIISHSTFSWWAAYLNDNPNKVVVAPKNWIIAKKDLENYNSDLYYPKQWVKI